MNLVTLSGCIMVTMYSYTTINRVVTSRVLGNLNTYYSQPNHTLYISTKHFYTHTVQVNRTFTNITLCIRKMRVKKFINTTI